MEGLTVAGLKWAKDNYDTSQVARVAVLVFSGAANDWPEAFKRTAVRMCNESGRAAA